MVEAPYGIALLALGGLVGLLVGAAFLAAAIYTLVGFSHWIVDRRLRGLEPDDPAAPPEPALGRTIAAEVVSAGTFFALQPFGLMDPPQPADRILRRGRPILFVPGYLQTRTSFLFLAARLSSYGLGPLYSVNLASWDVGLDESADRLSARIDRILKATGARQLDVVAHSMGGLVTRLAEGKGPAAGRRPPRVRRLVTLGTPHHGTQIAHVLRGEAARQMRPGSELLARLPDPPVGQLVSIRSTHDFFVIPPEGARVAPVGRDVEVRRVGHLALLTDPDVAEEVVRALGEDIQFRRMSDLFETPSEPELVANRLDVAFRK